MVHGEFGFLWASFNAHGVFWSLGYISLAPSRYIVTVYPVRIIRVLNQGSCPNMIFECSPWNIKQSYGPHTLVWIVLVVKLELDERALYTYDYRIFGTADEASMLIGVSANLRSPNTWNSAIQSHNEGLSKDIN